MDTTIDNPSTVQVQGSLGSESKAVTVVVDEVHNQSSDSTDSMKENQPENTNSNRSSHSLLNDSVLSKSSTQQQPLTLASHDNSLTGLQLPHQPQQPTTCNDSAFNLSSDDESFADCPTFSPAVNKHLHLGGPQGGNLLRQSFGLDALVNNMGKFTFDQSINANSTVDIVATDEVQQEEERPVEEVKDEVAVPEIQEEDVKGDDKPEGPVDPIVQPEDTTVVIPEEAFPDPPPPLNTTTDVVPGESQVQVPEEVDEFAYDDVEMMSIVIEDDGGIDGLPGPGEPEEHYSNVALPEDVEEAFPEPPPASQLAVENNNATMTEEEVPVNRTQEVIPLQDVPTEPHEDHVLNKQEDIQHSLKMRDLVNESCTMDVDDFYEEVNQSIKPNENYPEKETIQEATVTLGEKPQQPQFLPIPPPMTCDPHPEEPLTTTPELAPEIKVPVALPELQSEQPLITKAKSMDARCENDEFSKDFKMPTMLRRSLSNQQQAGPNPFDGAPASAGILDQKKELFFSSKDFDFLQNKETANSLSTAIKDSVLLRFDPLINQPVIVESRAESAEVPRDNFFSLAHNNNNNQDVDEATRNGQRRKQFPQQSKRFSSLDTSAGPGDIASSTILVERLDDEEAELDGEQDEDSLLQVFGVVRSKQEATTENTNSGSNRSSAVGTGIVGEEVKRNPCPISKLVDVTMSLVDVNNDSNLSVTNTNNKESSVLNGVGGGLNQNITNTYNNNTYAQQQQTIHTINSNTTLSSSRNLSNINFEDLEFSKHRMSVDGSQQQSYQNGESKIRNERYGDMDRKMKEMEEKEELLLKRLTEKEKQIAKMGHIVEEYERSIAELMKDRAITNEEYEKRCLELETERNANYQHLSSLETTFSDLHVKYERSKQQMEALKKSEENLLADKKQSAEQAAMQEQRYEKLKMHAMQQMEIANTRLRDESSQSVQEISRLRALLKKEEITRCSLQEQLNQKTREIEELMKIWDELKSDP